ncbi:MFS transporter [Actinomadura sp. HBU206391]|uniref:MFS transporter n=1 Tax=Actinomadura sp. HBU206391 TaxID=2731692 RepID=UPI00164F7D75|nr:MFS transporter [Actinomadura sp. HBU206391]MBC6457324.1 MFS transporter [Actinomadura sp. HBU206391]
MAIPPLLRLGRAGVFSAVCVTLAATGHTVVSGAAVAPWALAVGFAGVMALSMTLSGHERAFATIFGGLLGGQFMLHVLFSATALESTAPIPGPAAAHAGHHVTALVAHQPGLSMVLAHYTAALLAALWLRRGERAVWTLTRQVAALAGRPARALLTAARPTPIIGPVRFPVTTAVTIRPTGRMLRHVLLRRGPPLRSTALSLV